MESSRRLRYSRIIFTAGIVLLTTLSILFLYETHQENASSEIIYHSQVTKQSLEHIFSQMTRRSANIRGYLLTNDTTMVTGMPNMQMELQHLDSLIADNPDQLPNAILLRKMIDSVVVMQDTFLTSNKAAKSSEALIARLVAMGNIKVQRIGETIRQMQENETKSSKEKELDVQMHTIIATLVGAAASIFSIIVFILAFFFIDQELKRSQLYINESQTLNQKVAEINIELEKANKDLQGLNRELASKNYQLEKYAKELSSFTHITSHDMQEPLRKIEFFASVIESQEQENLTPDGKRYLEKIKHSVGRMRKLFLSMLEFSLTNATDNPVEEVDLNEVLESTIQSLKVYIKDTHASIESEHLPTIKGIRYQLVQLFENVLSNAIKFRKMELAPEIQLRCNMVKANNLANAALRQDDQYYRIDFTDNGIGFDPKYSEKVFDIFQRLTPKTDAYSVGIGLAISRRIAENHGGILVAHAKPNEGSTFSLYLPIAHQYQPSLIEN